MQFTIINSIKELSESLSHHILEKTKAKKVLLDLSGGYDTRVNLAILLKNNIPFEAITHDQTIDDIKIARKICEYLNIKQHIITGEKVNEYKQKLDYDINIKGTGYTEWLSMLHMLHRSMQNIENIQKEKEKRLSNTSKSYSPIFEKDIKEKIKTIPIMYLAGGFIQKRLIEINYPKLLRFKFTYFDIRHVMVNKLHKSFVDKIYESYFSGTSRNYHEINKKIKSKE